MKKYLLSIGAALSAFAPIATTISCKNSQEHQPTGGKDTKPTGKDTKPTEKDKKQTKLIAEKNLGFDSTTGSKKPAVLEPSPTDEQIKKYNIQMKKFNQEQVQLSTNALKNLVKPINLNMKSTKDNKQPKIRIEGRKTPASFQVINEFNKQMEKFNKEQIDLFTNANKVIYQLHTKDKGFTIEYINSNNEHKININGEVYFVKSQEFKEKGSETSKVLLLYSKETDNNSNYYLSIYDKDKQKLIQDSWLKIANTTINEIINLYYDDPNNFLIDAKATRIYKHNNLTKAISSRFIKMGPLYWSATYDKFWVIIDENKTTGCYFIDLPDFVDVSNSSEELGKIFLKVLVSQTEGEKGFVILYMDKYGKKRLNVGGKDFSSEVANWKDSLINAKTYYEKDNVYKAIYKAYKKYKTTNRK